MIHQKHVIFPLSRMIATVIRMILIRIALITYTCVVDVLHVLDKIAASHWLTINAGNDENFKGLYLETLYNVLYNLVKLRQTYLQIFHEA